MIYNVNAMISKIKKSDIIPSFVNFVDLSRQRLKTWSNGIKRWLVPVSCPKCGAERWMTKYDISANINQKKHINCKSCSLGKPLSHDDVPKDLHIYVDFGDQKTSKKIGDEKDKGCRGGSNRNGLYTKVQCPKCGMKYYKNNSLIRNFKTVLCYKCYRSGLASRQFWKGGICIDSQGYVKIHVNNIPEKERHLIENRLLGRRKMYVSEHSYVMAKKLNRQLKKTEVVRHIDGVKTNNDPSNLIIGTTQDNTADHNTARKNAIYWKNTAAKLLRQLENHSVIPDVSSKDRKELK
jgi:hypothetical protein